MNLFKKRYRIVEDNYLGYEVQSRRWWFPFWLECSSSIGISNTHPTIEKAKEFIYRRVNGLDTRIIMEYNPHIEK
jgi:hypothetical protein